VLGCVCSLRWVHLRDQTRVHEHASILQRVRLHAWVFFCVHALVQHQHQSVLVTFVASACPLRALSESISL
jgi:hypothetical protein